MYTIGRQKQSCDGWDDYTCGRGRWSVVYDSQHGKDVATGPKALASGNADGAEPFIPSRRWEAWREGVEDYVYLHTLRERIDRSRAAGVKDPFMKEAMSILQRVTADVLGGGDEPHRVYDARRRITQAVIRLDRLLAPHESKGP